MMLVVVDSLGRFLTLGLSCRLLLTEFVISGGNGMLKTFLSFFPTEMLSLLSFPSWVGGLDCSAVEVFIMGTEVLFGEWGFGSFFL